MGGVRKSCLFVMRGKQQVGWPYVEAVEIIPYRV